MKQRSAAEAGSLQFECYGARLRVQAAETLLERLLPLLPPDAHVTGNEPADATFEIRAAGTPRVYGVKTSYQRGGRVFRTLAEAAAEMHLGVAMFARPFIFVHAGVAVWRGRAVVLPGRSMTGKSTMTAALVKAGATYFSDEYAVFDENGRVHPYRKPISLRNSGKAGVRFRAIATSRNRVAKDGAVPGVVAFLKFKDGVRWAPKTLTPAEAVLELFKNTVAARTRAEFALPVFGRAAREAIAIKGSRPEAKQTAAALLEMVAKKT